MTQQSSPPSPPSEPVTHHSVDVAATVAPTGQHSPDKPKDQPSDKDEGKDKDNSVAKEKLENKAATKNEAQAENEQDKEAVKEAAKAASMSVLAIDIGGSKVKFLATGQTEPRKAPTGKEFTPARLVEVIRAQAHDWEFEGITIGYPGLVGPHGPRSEAGNLGPGWVGFDFAAALDKPVKIVNDAAMQALGSYEGGRMLFLGLGTGLGSCLITGHVIVPLELGHLLYDAERTMGEVLGRKALERDGKGEWRKAVDRAVTALVRAFQADYVVVGGGNAKHVKEPPPGARLGHNLTAFRGGFRLWNVKDPWVMAATAGENPQAAGKEALRML